ncbi:glycosyltransferase [Nocardioides sp.]|uniref:glycosyltransferase n=1 Tax=Nocardioides sp. TaxID=35761 RepID=UPI00286B8BE9|nr:glycosyltransferase [Nocardioides sp.]
MHIAMIGTRGVPARYGGFETAVEEIGSRLAEMGHDVTVYCRNPGQSQREHLGMRLVNLPAVRRRSLETLSHTFLSIVHSMVRKPDVAVMFNAGNAPFIRLLRARGIPFAIHMDGLEWKRSKWQGNGARYYRWAERAAAGSGAALIADAHGIAEHLHQSYGVESYYIPYGATIAYPRDDRLGELGLRAHEFHLVVARMEPENHVDLIVGGYVASGSTRPLVVVGTAPYGSSFTAKIDGMAARSGQVMMLGALWDQELLDQLYGNARSYLHGHSVGGTNPSLLRALGSGAPVSAFDVNFNREVAGPEAQYFHDVDSVAECIRVDDSASTRHERGERGRRAVKNLYAWDRVARDYEKMLQELMAQQADRRRRPRAWLRKPWRITRRSP